MARRPSVDQVEAQALEAAAGLKSAGAKLVCIDFDATFVSVHTGGRWSGTAEELRTHVRRFFLLLVPLLCESDVNVAIVTFSPQVTLIHDVLQLCFDLQVARHLVIRGDDRSWNLTHDQTGAFLPLWQTGGLHLDRKFKLPFIISAALEVQRRSGVAICNRDTVLVDDDALNVRVANDSGLVGVFFDPNERDEEKFCKSIRKLHGAEPQEPQSTVMKTPNRKPRTGSGVKLVAKEYKFLATSNSTGARRRLGVAPGSSGRTSTFNMCTPSPVMKLKCVDFGRPRSKRASRILKSYSREMEAALPVVSESSAFSVDEPTTPTKQPASLREPAETQGLPTSPIVYKM
ncbi:hypothetical protein V7S43_013331 [Phytophthora oleae]|uniref:ATP-binding Cassette (ABC) superfamily n=1 Tax=Phytophthora oleae TaxID=2107226 RepID=A0ABD3F7C3_9STRA